MADHKIKSKSKSRWNHSSVLSRCSNPEDGQLSGHFLKGNTWEYLPLQNFTLDDEKISTIISTAQINHPYLLLEVSFEKQSGILAPKVTCYRLCDSTVLGKTVSTPIGSSRTDPTLDPQQPSKLFPTQRLQITSKGLTEACKEKILLLVNLLESRSKQKIQKISCVFVVEDYKNCATHPEYKIKLHHTNEIQFSQKKSSTSGASSSLRLLNNRSSAGFLPSSVSHQSISESGYSECVSEITTSARGYLHKFKCEGDFCLFNSEEEGMQLQLSEELEFNINRERKHAIQRNRSAEEIDGRGGEDDDDDDAYRSNILAATSTQSSHNHSGGATGGGPGGASNGTQAYKISVKSIFLARNEMKLLDARLQNSSSDISSPPKEKNLPPELRHWSSLLLSWYCRIGRSVIQKYAQPAVPIPVSSGHHISKALLRGQGSSGDGSGDCEDANKSREFDDETHMTAEKTKLSKNSKNKTVNLSSSTLKQFTSTSTASGSVSLAMASPSRDQDQLSQLIPYDLQENSYHPQHHNETSAKHLGRYYSSSLVCERCYYVYKELNRLRNIEFQNTLRTKKREEVEEKIALREENNSRYLSQRMEQMNNFANQRIATYRLSKSKHSSAGEEMCGEGDREYPQRLGAGAGGGGGYSLPPLPWQLSHDERKRQEYQQQGSAFVRNIQSKTQQILELTAQKNQDFFSGRGGGGAGEDNELDPNFDWKKTLLSQYGAGAGTSGRSDPNTSSRRRGGGGGELMKSGSAGSGSGMGKGRGAGGGRKGKEKKKSFDHERLLHPYQRYLEQMKREEREERLGRGEGRGEGREAIERTQQPHLQQQHQQREQHRHQQQQTQSSNPQSSHSQSQSQSGGFGRSGKSFSLSLLPVLEHEQEEGQGSPQKSQSMTTLPPLVPRARPQPSQQPSTTAFSSSSSPQKSFSKPLPTRALSSGEDSDGDDEEDEDDGIGWSPFVVT
jgi:hypothetical protein